MTRIDANVELDRELVRLSARSELASDARRTSSLYGYLASGMAQEVSTGAPGEFTNLTEKLLTRLSIWWPPSGLAVVPIMAPWAIRDRSARYDCGPESWGAPRADGFLRDDNSIVKKLPLPLTVSADGEHPYAGRRPWRGFTACHIWRVLADGEVAGTDPWLYSFMPNLVWLPSQLAPLSDRHGSFVQLLLQRTALALFRDVEARPSVARYVSRAWSRLPVPSSGPSLPTENLAHFDVDRAFVRRRLAYLDRFVQGADSVLATGQLGRKLICSRYTVGMPLLEREAITRFRDDLARYRDAVGVAIHDGEPRE